MKIQLKREIKNRRHRRARAKIFGTIERPRLCVFRSLNHIYAQLIDDDNGKILAVASDKGLKVVKSKDKKEEKGRKITLAFKTGELIAEKAKKLDIKKISFDRGGYKYHGRVEALATGAREKGLIF